MQQIFDKITAHLLKQGEKSVLTMFHEKHPDQPICRYRSTNKNGDVLKCAVGILIPDAEYHVGLEHKSVRNLAVVKAAGLKFTDADARGICSGSEVDLASALQSVHDNMPVKDWPREFQRIATMFGLKNGN